MRKVTEDRRTRKTKAAIEKAFLELMTKKDISKITIRDITDKADTNRSTFYTHYEDIYDLLDSIENKVLEEMAVLPEFDMQTLIDGGHIDITPALEYIKNNRAVFAALMHSSRNAKFLRKITALFEKIIFGSFSEKLLPRRNEAYRKMLICFFVNGITSVVEQWVSGNSDTSEQQINYFIEDILKAGINGLR